MLSKFFSRPGISVTIDTLLIRHAPLLQSLKILFIEQPENKIKQIENQ